MISSEETQLVLTDPGQGEEVKLQPTESNTPAAASVLRVAAIWMQLARDRCGWRRLRATPFARSLKMIIIVALAVRGRSPREA